MIDTTICFVWSPMYHNICRSVTCFNVLNIEVIPIVERSVKIHSREWISLSYETGRYIPGCSKYTILRSMTSHIVIWDWCEIVHTVICTWPAKHAEIWLRNVLEIPERIFHFFSRMFLCHYMPLDATRCHYMVASMIYISSWDI